MDPNMPTEPLPPAQEPQPVYTAPVYTTQAHPPFQQPVQPVEPVHEPFYKRYGLAFAISTLVLGSFVILAFVGAGAFAVGNVITHSGFGISRFEQGPLQPQPQPGIPGQGKGQGNGQGKGQGAVPGPNSGSQLSVVRGTITNISGSTWTVETQRGASVAVQLTSATQFGTPTRSESASDFAVGQQVVVLGARSGGTITADRVLDLAGFTQPGQTSPGVPSTPSPSPTK
jgi:hypothetical protein